MALQMSLESDSDLKWLMIDSNINVFKLQRMLLLAQTICSALHSFFSAALSMAPSSQVGPGIAAKRAVTPRNPLL